MGIIEKKKIFGAILAALIILIRKRLNRSKISSVIEKIIFLLVQLGFVFAFLFVCFSSFFVNLLFFTKFC